MNFRKDTNITIENDNDKTNGSNHSDKGNTDADEDKESATKRRELRKNLRRL